MNDHERRSVRPWHLFFVAVMLIGGPIMLYHILPLVGVPAALVSGVVLVAAVKHLGLMAVLLTPLYAFQRRRRR